MTKRNKRLAGARCNLALVQFESVLCDPAANNPKGVPDDRRGGCRRRRPRGVARAVLYRLRAEHCRPSRARTGRAGRRPHGACAARRCPRRQLLRGGGPRARVRYGRGSVQQLGRHRSPGGASGHVRQAASVGARALLLPLRLRLPGVRHRLRAHRRDDLLRHGLPRGRAHAGAAGS